MVTILMEFTYRFKNKNDEKFNTELICECLETDSKLLDFEKHYREI